MWHEARRSEKIVIGMMNSAQKRAELRSKFLAKKRGDPMQSLKIIGYKTKIYHDISMYRAVEQQQGMIPWSGRDDNLIDRFDGRSLLDFIREYDPKKFPPRDKTDEEEELDERLNFESYRDLIKLKRKGLTDEQGLEDIDEELEAKAMASLATEKEASAGSASKQGVYARIGYKYGGEEPPKQGEESEDGSEDEEQLSSEGSEDEGLTEMGRQFGVEDFNRLLFLERKAKNEEKRIKDMAASTEKRGSRRDRRRAARQGREKEMEAFRYPARSHRRSPVYESYKDSGSFREGERARRGRERGSDDENAEEEPQHPKIEFITEFGGSSRVGPSSAPRAELSSDALPPRDPSWVAGPQVPILEALRSDPALERPPPPPLPDRERPRSHGAPKPAAVSGSSAAAKLSKGGLAGGSKGSKAETPQERLKRIMNRQLSKQIKKDSVQESERKLRQEREQRESREKEDEEWRERNRGRRRDRSFSPYRSRSRSPSPRHGRSRSRSPRR